MAANNYQTHIGRLNADTEAMRARAQDEVRNAATMDLRGYAESLRGLSDALTAIENTMDPQEMGPRQLAYVSQLTEHSKRYGPQYDAVYMDLVTSTARDGTASASSAVLASFAPNVLRQRMQQLRIDPGQLRSDYTIEGLRALNWDASQEDLQDAIDFRNGRIQFDSSPNADNSRFRAARAKDAAFRQKKLLMQGGDTETTYSDIMATADSFGDDDSLMPYSENAVQLRGGYNLGRNPDNAAIPGSTGRKILAQNKAWRGVPVKDYMSRLDAMPVFSNMNSRDFIVTAAANGIDPSSFEDMSFLNGFEFGNAPKSVKDKILMRMFIAKPHIDAQVRDMDDPEGARQSLWQQFLESPGNEDAAVFVRMTPENDALASVARTKAREFTGFEDSISSNRALAPEVLRASVVGGLRGMPGFAPISDVLGGSEYDDLKGLVSTDDGLESVNTFDMMNSAFSVIQNDIARGGGSATDAQKSNLASLLQNSVWTSASHAGFAGRADAVTAADRISDGLGRLAERHAAEPTQAFLNRAIADPSNKEILRIRADADGVAWNDATDKAAQIAWKSAARARTRVKGNNFGTEVGMSFSDFGGVDTQLGGMLASAGRVIGASAVGAAAGGGALKNAGVARAKAREAAALAQKADKVGEAAAAASKAAGAGKFILGKAIMKTIAGGAGAGLATNAVSLVPLTDDAAAVFETAGEYIYGKDPSKWTAEEELIKEARSNGSYYVGSFGQSLGITAAATGIGLGLGGPLGAAIGSGVGSVISELVQGGMDMDQLVESERRILPGLKRRDGNNVSQLSVLYALEDRFGGIGNVPEHVLARLPEESKLIIAGIAGKLAYASERGGGAEVFPGSDVSMLNVYGPRLMKYFKDTGENLTGTLRPENFDVMLKQAMIDGRIRFSEHGSPDGKNMFRAVDEESDYFAFEVPGTKTIVDIPIRSGAEGVAQIASLIEAARNPANVSSDGYLTEGGFDAATKLMATGGDLNRATTQARLAFDKARTNRESGSYESRISNQRKLNQARIVAGAR
jgi:hypothetical protein